MRVAALIAGIVLTAAAFFALCQAMLIPRRSTSWIVRGVNGSVAAIAKAPLPLFRSYQAQDRWLSGAAPISVLLQLVVYVIILILTMGLVIYGTTDLSLNDAMYQSGSTVTTLGIVEPVNEASTIASFVAAFLGLVVIAVFVGYLMALYGAYVQRESGMARAAMLAGEPAWGPMFLVRGQMLGLPADALPDASIWLDWLCVTRLNQQVNPVLMEFRSTSSRRHWVTTTLAVLDAAALQVSIREGTPDPRHVQLLTEGTVTLWAIVGEYANAGAGAEVRAGAAASHNGDLERIILNVLQGLRSSEQTGGDCGVTRAEFDEALAMFGDQVVVSPDVAWDRFRMIRSMYFSTAAGLAKRLHAVPAPWSGPRKPPLPVQYPEYSPK